MLAVEQRFRFELDATTLTGFIDRIDRLPDGRLRLIDYKTSKSAMKKDEAEQDLQLALYALACRDVPELRALGEVSELVYMYPRQLAHGRRPARADDDARSSRPTRGAFEGSSAQSPRSSSSSPRRRTALGASSRRSARVTTSGTRRCEQYAAANRRSR